MFKPEQAVRDVRRRALALNAYAHSGLIEADYAGGQRHGETAIRVRYYAG